MPTCCTPAIARYLLVAVLCIGGCATVARERFYSLADAVQPLPEEAARPPKGQRTGYVVQVGPVSVPELVDRAQLVVRDGPHEVAILEQHRWAATLASDVSHTLANAIDRALTGGAALPYETGQAVTREPDVVLAVAVLRFDTLVGSAAAVDDDIAWSARCRGGSAATSGEKNGVEKIHLPVAEHGHEAAAYSALVAAHARALAAAAAAMAPAIEAIGPSCAGSRGSAR